MSGNREQNFLAKFTDFISSELPMPLWLNSCQLGNPNNYKHILEAYKNGSLGPIVKTIAEKTTTAIPPVIDATTTDDYSAGRFSPSDDRVKNPSKFTATLGEWLNDPGVDLIERIQLADEYSYISKGSGLWIQFKGEVNGKIDEPPKIATSQGIGRISVIANQDIKPLEHDNNETSDRYGLPTKYQITTYVDDGNGPQPKQTTVHWTRLIIVSESNKNFGVFGDKVLAAPLLHPSRAIDLIAGSYGLGYFNHTQFKTITNVDDKSQQAFKQAIGDKDTKKQLDEEDGIQEYSTRDLNKMHESMDMGTTEKIMKEVQGIMQNRLCALLTCAGVKHCEECASFLPSDEYAIITDKTGVKDRKAILDGAKNGELNERGTYRYKYILQIGCLTTGVNVPPWDTSVLLRRIGSLTLLNQLLGRGMRLLKPKHIEMGMHKENHLCLDYSGTMESMHQLFNDPMLEDAIMEKDKSERRMIACPNCGGEVGERCSICPHCQHLLQFELCEDIKRGIGLAEYVFKKGCGHKNTKGTRVCKKCGGYMKDPEANLRADSYDANDWFEVDGMTLEAFGNGGGNIKVTYLLKNGSKAEKNYFGLTGKGKHIFKGDFINTHINCRQWQGKIAGMMNSGNIQGIVKMQKMFGCPAFITHRINDKGQSVVHGKQFLDKRTFMGGKTVDPTK